MYSTLHKATQAVFSALSGYLISTKSHRQDTLVQSLSYLQDKIDVVTDRYHVALLGSYNADNYYIKSYLVVPNEAMYGHDKTVYMQKLDLLIKPNGTIVWASNAKSIQLESLGEAYTKLLLESIS